MNIKAYAKFNLTLDVKNNALARDYAAKYSIPTDFRSSWGFTVAASAVGAAILGAAFFAFDRFVLKKRAKTKPSEKKIKKFSEILYRFPKK